MVIGPPYGHTWVSPFAHLPFDFSSCNVLSAQTRSDMHAFCGTDPRLMPPAPCLPAARPASGATQLHAKSLMPKSRSDSLCSKTFKSKRFLRRTPTLLAKFPPCVHRECMKVS